MMMNDDFLWVEKYRPETVSECILPDATKRILQKVVDSGKLQHMLFYSGPGSGKTTSAIAICKELGKSYIVINGSNEGRLLDTIRNIVIPFASTGSLDGSDKVVIYDEVDNAGTDVMKQLRGVMEQVQGNCKFIFTCNYLSKVIDALQSRTAMVSFNVEKKQMPKVASQFMTRTETILTENKVEYDKKVLAEFVMKYFPDFRKSLNELQKYASIENKIDIGILEAMSTNLDEYLGFLKVGDFKGARKWIAQNTPNSSFYGNLNTALYTTLTGETMARAILILADYQYKHAFAADAELNISACTIELMAECFNG